MRQRYLTIGTAFFIFVLNTYLNPAPVFGQNEDFSKLSLQEQRKRLAVLKHPLSADQVIKTLGKPDEVRLVPEDGLLDGVRLMGDRFTGSGPETERWVYGALKKGAFPKIGYVSMDRDGKMVAAVSADCFADPMWTLEQIPATTEKATAGPSKMTCELSEIEDSAGRLKAKLTIKNAGTAEFKLKHPAEISIGFLKIVELYDARGTLLFRDFGLRYFSPLGPGPWAGLAVRPAKEHSAEIGLNPSLGFGSLPPGTYSLRAYFPFDDEKFYPSNLLRFELKEDQAKEPNRDKKP